MILAARPAAPPGGTIMCVRSFPISHETFAAALSRAARTMLIVLSLFEVVA